MSLSSLFSSPCAVRKTEIMGYDAQTIIIIVIIIIIIIISTKTKAMAMCGNYIQGVKIVINNNIIEEVTDFKYLGYRIAEYKSDLEDKLQIYNKINGAIGRHFGKQMNKETKLTLRLPD